MEENMNWFMILGGPPIGIIAAIIGKTLKLGAFEIAVISFCCCFLWCLLTAAIDWRKI
jgi:hypothetical protein